MPPIFGKLEGKSGRIDVPELGSTVGQLVSWTLRRRSDTGVEADFYDLHAVCSFIQRGVFSDDEYAKEVVIQIGGQNGRPYRLIPTSPGERTVLAGKSLIMERVALVAIPLERERP